MNFNDTVEILAIIDRSGSMGHLRQDAIGGFNTFLAEQQKLDGNANLTLVLFDHEYLVQVPGVPVQEVEPLTEETYVPRGGTAMNDAIGRALAELEEKNPGRAIITILTDGEENASVEYTSELVKTKIKAAEERGWQVVFLAANIDAFQAGGQLGVSLSNTRGFVASASGMASALNTITTLVSSYRSEPITAQATAITELKTRITPEAA